MGILAALTLLIYGLTLSTTRALLSGEDRILLEMEQRQAVRRLQRVVPLACPGGAASPPLVFPDLEESGNRLVFTSMEDLLNTGQAFDPANPSIIEYRLVQVNGELLLDRSDGLGTPRTICRGVQQVQFTNINQRALVVDLTLEGEVLSARGSREIQQRTLTFTILLPDYG